MQRAEQRHSTRRIAKPPELIGLLPQLGPQVRDNINEGRRGQKGRICTRESNDVGKNPQSAPVTFQKLHDVCRNAVFAHVNQTT